MKNLKRVAQFSKARWVALLKKIIPVAFVKHIRNRFAPPKEMHPEQAYNLWSVDYDNQPDNLVMALDQVLFNKLIATVPIENKTIIDIGCGTGRHWANMLTKNPAKLIGYDVSEGMLNQLQKKYPGAETYTVKSDQLNATANTSCELIISTLTIGYIADLASAFKEWDRVLKPGGDILITDFHPGAVASGGKRSFGYQKKMVSIRNYLHTIEAVEQMAKQQQWHICGLTEIPIDDSVRPFFERKQAIHVFEEIKGMSIIYGVHFKKTNVTF